jgi:hypothetical protein
MLFRDTYIHEPDVKVFDREGEEIDWVAVAGNSPIVWVHPTAVPLTADDRPVIEGSSSWLTEAKHGADDGTGRRCAYADNQYRRSVRRAARQVLRAYCR